MTKDGIRFFNLEKNGINYEDENMKKIIEIIKNKSSKLEIKQKKNENEKNNKTNEEEIRKIINDMILDGELKAKWRTYDRRGTCCCVRARIFDGYGTRARARC